MHIWISWISRMGSKVQATWPLDLIAGRLRFFLFALVSVLALDNNGTVAMWWIITIATWSYQLNVYCQRVYQPYVLTFNNPEQQCCFMRNWIYLWVFIKETVAESSFARLWLVCLFVWSSIVSQISDARALFANMYISKICSFNKI